MKWIAWVVSVILVHDLHGSNVFSVITPEAVEAVQDSPKNVKTETIDAVLALAKSSIMSGQDTVEALKNAMILFSEFKGIDRVYEALAELLATTLRSMESALPVQCNATEPAVQDYDCMEREFDVSDSDFDPEEAAAVFGKCRLLVLRNVFSKTVLQKYRENYDHYVYAIHTGEIDRFKTKTTDSFTRDIVQGRGRKRHDIILPQWLTGKEFTSDPTILEILRNDAVLGPDMFLNHLGSVISESGAPSMNWHEDTSHIWSRESFEANGIGGHDLPPYALSMFVPLFANGTYDHGPTEYCVGSSHLDGMLGSTPKVRNKASVQEGSVFAKMQDFRNSGVGGACPPEHWRVPLLDMGDAILFDYQITHRGGPNRSPDSRALLYAMYSRFWFRDGNFDVTESEDDDSDGGSERLRHAVVDESTVERSPQASTTIASLANFAGISGNDEEDATTNYVDFFFTNHNVENVLLSFDGGSQDEIAPKEQWLLNGEVGTKLWAHDKEGNVKDSWIVTEDQQEIILVDRFV